MCRYMFTVDHDKSLLTGKISGVWNITEARNYTDDFEKMAESFNGESWVNLLDFKEWKSSMPEVLPVIAGNLSWAGRKGMRKTAFINSSPVIQDQLYLILERSGLGELARVFDNREVALDWLES